MASHIERRKFLATLGAAATWPLTVRAQQPTRRIGMLIGYSENDPEIQARLVAFRQALEGNGWKEGRSVLIDYRFAPASPDQAQVFAKELVALQPDVLVGNSRHSGAAARDAHHSNRVRGRVRSSRQPLCGEHRATRRQHDRLH